jgi:hypothetical protein
MIELKASRSLDVLPGRALVASIKGEIPRGTIFLWDGVPTDTEIEVQEKESGKKYFISVHQTVLEEI